MKKHLKWLLEITAIPTAAGQEWRVVNWIEHWALAQKGVKLRKDAFGNLL